MGRPINFHDLRATGATRLAQRGAHVAEVQAFLGDSSSQAAERYVRAAKSRMDDLTALAFDGLDFGGVPGPPSIRTGSSPLDGESVQVS